MLGIPSNEFEIPDYEGIEIKAKSSNKQKYIGLFNYKSESKYYMNNERLKDLYGYPDKDYPEYLTLCNSVYCTKETIIGKKYKFKLNVNRKDMKVYLFVYDLSNNLIDSESYWSFDEIKEKLYRKMTYLAFFKARRKTNDGIYYYKYHMITLYKLRDFDTFIKLIEMGYIRISFKIGIYKDEKKFGKTYDHGTSFEIQESDLPKLYDTIQKVW